MDFVACVKLGKRPFSNVETGRMAAKSVLLANRAAEIGTLLHWGDT